MTEKLEVSIVLAVEARRLYEAWLDSETHAAFTGSPAHIAPLVGGEFTAWDGYIMGRTLELEPFRRILQAWRTTEFPEGAADSRLELLLEPVEGGTRLTLRHTDIPEGQASQYEEGWRDFYFAPMAKYFSENL